MMCEMTKEAIESILKNGKIYEVGGAVRDRLLFDQLKSKDHDYLVTGIPYNDLSKILKKYGKVDLVGRSFGVIKFTQFFDGNPKTFDISLPRKEFSTGLGHKDFTVDFDPNLSVEEDLNRRDFTINSIAVELGTKNLVDPLNGSEDIKKRQIKMVYDNSFKDDPLRMLRAIQFAARFNFEIEEKTYLSLCENAELIKTVSPERIQEEFNKLLRLAEKPSVGFRLMEKSNLLKHILPEMMPTVKCDQPGGYHKYDVFEHTLHVIDAAPPKLVIRMAALFHDINKPQRKRLVDKGATFYGHESFGAKTAKTVLKRLRYSNDFIKDVVMLVERHMFTTDVTDKGLRRLLKRVGARLIFDLLDLRRADVEGQGMGGTTEDVDQFEADIKAEIDRKPPISLRQLALNGNEIMEVFDLKPGREVGEILDYLMELVLDNPEFNNREDLESKAKEFYQTKYKKSIDDKGINE